MADSHILGKEGEEIAADHLRQKGYNILHRNWNSGKREIDIIAETGDFIVFVEVKTRAHDFQIPMRHVVTNQKQKTLEYAAEAYIKRYNIDKESRFDIVYLISDGKSVKIDHIENAFYSTLR